MSPDEPTELVGRVAAGDRAAFALLARRLHPAGYRLALRVLGDPVEAEDALQAAFLNLWTRAGQFDAARGPVAAWFARVVVNACLDRRRRLRPAEALGDDAVADEPGPGDAAEAGDLARRVARAVERLHPRQRAAVALFYGEDASTNDVADALETTPKAVEGLLARARADLRRILETDPR